MFANIGRSDRMAFSTKFAVVPYIRMRVFELCFMVS